MMNEHTGIDLIHALAIGAILFALAIMHGCILGPIAGSQLNSEQMQALKDYNDRGDIYLCALLGGPPPVGSIVAIAVPKGTAINVQFSPDCHAQVVSGVPPSGIMTPNSTRVTP